MSAYPPPTDLTPIFNAGQFTTPNSSNLDTAFLDAHYVQYPDAQDSLTIPSAIIANGMTTGGSIVIEPNASPPTNYLEFPDGTQQYTSATTSNGTALLSSANTWTNTNNFSAGSTTTTASAGDNSNMSKIRSL